MNAHEMTLREFAQDALNNLDNPNYVPPELPPYVPPTPELPLQYLTPKRELPKVWTSGDPSVMSTEWRQALDNLFAGLDSIEPEIVESATSASEGNRGHYERALTLHLIGKENVAKVAELRDAHRYKEVMATPAAAIAKLNELKVQEKFVVPDHMAHNMQALISKRNQKEHGKRFKTSRVNGDKSFLQVWRTR